MPLNTRDPVPNPSAMPDTFYRPAPVMWKGYPGEKCVVDKVSAPQHGASSTATRLESRRRWTCPALLRCVALLLASDDRCASAPWLKSVCAAPAPHCCCCCC